MKAQGLVQEVRKQSLVLAFHVVCTWLQLENFKNWSALVTESNSSHFVHWLRCTDLHPSKKSWLLSFYLKNHCVGVSTGSWKSFFFFSFMKLLRCWTWLLRLILIFAFLWPFLMLCWHRHTTATLRLFEYNQILRLHGQILLAYSWRLVTLTELFSTTR